MPKGAARHVQGVNVYSHYNIEFNITKYY